MKKVLPAFLIVFLVFAGVVVFPKIVRAQINSPGLFFSEYIEGDSNNKALEIYNPTSLSVNVNGYKVERYTNGSVTVSGTLNLPNYDMPTNSMYVICNAGINAGVLGKCNLTSGVLTFNGNDAVVLKNNNGEMLDVIGQIGIDPGEFWGSGDVTTMDHTLVRKCNVSHGDVVGSDVFDPAAEWNGLAVDTFTNLGTHSTCYSPTITPTLTPTPEITPTEIPIPTVEPTTEPTPTQEPTPTSTEIIVAPTPTTEPTPTLTPEVTPTITSTPTPQPTPTPTQEKYNWKHWACENKVIKIKWGKRFKEITVPICYWQWPWWDFRFSPLHKHH